MTNNEPYCCNTTRPTGYTYHPFVTVCATCYTQFPYYDCYCELEHTCDPETRQNNINHYNNRHKTEPPYYSWQIG